MKTLANFSEANQALDELWMRNPPSISPRKPISPYKLDTMRTLLAYLGNPQDTFKVVHVAGTSGKTSTAYYAASLLHAAGKKVGLTVSPHVDEVNERVQIDLIPLPEVIFCTELAQFLELIEKSGTQPSYFETLAAFAFWEFARQKVDYAVVEVGLGGLLDATNTITRADKVCILTDIGLDHIEVLGRTLGEIAHQKAGIIQPGNTVFCYEQGTEVMQVFKAAVNRQQADLRVLDTVPEYGRLPELPLFQQRNFGLSMTAVLWLLAHDKEKTLSPAAITHAAVTLIPGRMEQRQLSDGSTLIMDGAHNGQKLETLVASLRARFPQTPVATLVSFVAGREGRIDQGIAALARISTHIIVTTFDGGQDTHFTSVSPEDVVAACQAQGFKEVTVITDPLDAYRALLARPEEVKLVTGSFYLLAALRAKI